MVVIITHFVLISLVLVVVTAQHIDVVVAFVGNSAKPFDGEDMVVVVGVGDIPQQESNDMELA